MGGGDWNDGMNEVGMMGKGESVWLAWFLYTVMGDFIPLCRQAGDEAYGRELEQKRENLLQSIEEHAWMGSGIFGPFTMTVPNWDQRKMMNAGSIPSASPGA